MRPDLKLMFPELNNIQHKMLFEMMNVRFDRAMDDLKASIKRKNLDKETAMLINTRIEYEKKRWRNHE